MHSDGNLALAKQGLWCQTKMAPFVLQSFSKNIPAQKWILKFVDVKCSTTEYWYQHRNAIKNLFIVL
jgi:hypothetical protein